MRVSRSTALSIMLATAAPCAAVLATPAAAQAPRISQPALPMAEALERIAATTGRAIAYDPDAVRGLTANPVRNAADAQAAVLQAIRDQSLALMEEDGRLMVTNDIVVRARTDEAEINLLVRQASSSTRTGQSLRDQPRNSQVISDRLIREQQSLTVTDALRNAGGVTVNNAALQGGATYGVRGFNSDGALNGLPGSSGVSAGATQPVANIERIEVLKGPDAILIGNGNQGGLINIVTKKPSADPRLTLEAQTGSFGLRRFVLDANTALTNDEKVSGRIIGSASDADRNFGGYRGDRDFLFAPSLRFKDGKTDIILNASIGEQSFGSSPVAVFDATTGSFVDVPRDQPLLRVADQGASIDTTQFFGEATHQPTSWLTLVARAQHQKVTFAQAQFAPLGLVGPNTLFVSGSNIRQEAVTNAVDGYARFDVTTGAVTHSLTAGYTFATSDTDYFNAPDAFFGTYNFVTATAAPGVLPRSADNLNLQQQLDQSGYYGQYLVKFWKLALLAGVRNNKVVAEANNIVFNEQLREETNSTVPNFGAVFDVSDDISLFGTLAYGYIPTTQLDRERNRLPDNRTRNIEGGVKIDLLGDRALINASYFELRQSNLIVQDPTGTPDVTGQLPFIAVPGQRARGLDLNVSGEIAKGLQINGAFSRTKYRPLTPNEFLTTIVGMPRDQYSLYASYRRPVGGVTLGGAGGLFGRSSAPADSLGTVFSPASRQVDISGFLEIGALIVNLNVRNVLNRENYGISYQSSVFPLNESRNWRLSATYRFK